MEEENKDNANSENKERDLWNEIDTRCGIGSCKPRWLQVCANIEAFTGCYSIVSIVCTSLFSYVISQITTLERQFGLSSTQAGVIVASNDIGYLALTMIVGYFAYRVHIPRFMGATVMFFGISGLICSLPHFLFGAEDLPAEQDVHSNITFQQFGQLCLPSNDSVVDVCQKVKSQDIPEHLTRRQGKHSSVALGLIVLGMIMQGMAKAPKNIFTLTYLDDNVKKFNTGFYYGIINCLTIFGPAIAFGLGSYFTRLYVTLGDTDLHPRHPRWIGAWWLGYVVFGSAAILVGVPLFCFPRRLKNAPRDPPIKFHSSRTKKTMSTRLFAETKDYGKILLSLMTNPLYIILNASTAVHLFTLGGSHAFLPKYLETQFGIPAWNANLLIAGFSMSSASVGIYCGGWILKKYKMSPTTGLKFVTVGTSISLMFFSLGFGFGCPQPQILKYPGTPTIERKSSDNCSTNCHCNDNDFLPICGSDSNNYYSPCHAGCVLQERGLYGNCSCIRDGGKAVAGFCDFQCPFLYPYMGTIAASVLMGTMAYMPKLIATIRCVPEREKPMSIAFASFIISLFGWLLGPIVYGSVIDSVCLLWDEPCPGQRGACVLYDLSVFRVKMHGFFVACELVSILLIFISLVIAIKSKKYEKLEKADEEEKAERKQKDEEVNFL